MAVTSSTTIAVLTDLQAALIKATKALDGELLVKNPATGLLADLNSKIADLTSAIAATGALSSGTKSIITTAVKITAPVTGSGTTGVTPTIVNGVVTGLVLS